MGRHAEGWKLRAPDAFRPNFTIYFTHPKTHERIERSTGERDEGPASKAAARIYADVIHGRQATSAVAGNARDLGTDVAEWLTYYGATHAKNPGSLTNARSRAATVVEYFAAYDSITRESVRAWGVKRLGEVTRRYHRKERSTLRVFLAWAHAKGYAGEPIDFAPLPKGSNGVRVTKQKNGATILTPSQVETLLAKMPERSHGGGGATAINIRHRGFDLPLSAWARVYGVPLPTLYYRHVTKCEPLRACVKGLAPVADPAVEAARGLWVRPFFEVLWETGLRPVTVMRLAAGVHYTKGTRKLVITDDADKVEYGRTVPLTDRARAALDRAYPASGEGPIFGVHDYGAQLEKAKRAARTPVAFTIYDVRHSRLTALASATGDVMGVAYAAGHRDVSTTAVYLHGQEKDAARMFAAYARRSDSVEDSVEGTKGTKKANRARSKKPN
jgi:integrase